MIIAILEDKKGFKDSVDIARRMPHIDIPLRNPESGLRPFLMVDEGPTLTPYVRFYFYKWLRKDDIALYRER